jgi:hypothetical protein
MIHHADGIEAFRPRRDLARTHLSGIGSVCGYGRLNREQLLDILRIPAQNADELTAT